MRIPLFRFIVLGYVTLIVLSGCDSDNIDLDRTVPSPTVSPASDFDPSGCGRIVGQVTWTGPIPVVQDWLYGAPKGDGNFEIKMMPNPNRPRIDPETKVVANAVVFLRGVDATKARPWNLSPVRVEMSDRQIVVLQGDATPGRVGFVRRGDRVTLVSADPFYHIVRGRGAAFFSLTFPQRDQPLERRLDQPGRVELSSGAGFYWASADLFVDDHPYYTLTDSEGRFVLDQVPAGPVEVVAWLPGWDAARQERDPETGLILRQTYTPPIEAIRKATVTKGDRATVLLDLP